MIMTCSRCGKKWSVSIFANIPESGYICPYCDSKRDNKRMEASVLTNVSTPGKESRSTPVNTASVKRAGQPKKSKPRQSKRSKRSKRSKKKRK